MFLRCGPKSLDLSAPVVMGVLNVTPDSFSDGGKYDRVELALEHALRMVDEGATIIDVGGESTRPGAQPVAADEEIRRVVPVIRELARAGTVTVSVDTHKAEVMRAAVEAGAHFINDVMALRTAGAINAAHESGAAVCLMHMQGEPRTMQANPHYGDVVAEVREFFARRVEACLQAGIATDRLVLDPGIGFGKRLEHNVALLAALPDLGVHGLPLLIGASRKSMFATLLGRALEDRLPGALATAAASVLAGAKIIRTHDVRETLDAIKVAAALQAAGYRITTSTGD